MRVRLITRRVAWRIVPAAALVLAMAAGAALGLPTTTSALRPVKLPRDHGAHPASTIEWWYTAGTLADAGGRHFFWFATLWSGVGARVARVNVVDLHADRIVLSREFVSATPVTSGQTRLAVAGFRLGWRPPGRWGRWSVDVATGRGGVLRLNLSPRQPYMLNGHDGIIEQGFGGPSAYYSDPRLAARGSLRVEGRTRTVRGQGWLDHQWGNFVSDPNALRWNWFACQFNAGSDLMLYQFLASDNRPTGSQNGTLLTRGNTVTHVVHFTVTPLRPRIRPPGAQTTYPLRWRLTVPARHIDITIRARARHQFIANRFVPSFWEGAASIIRGPAGQCIVESSREVRTSS